MYIYIYIYIYISFGVVIPELKIKILVKAFTSNCTLASSISSLLRVFPFIDRAQYSEMIFTVETAIYVSKLLPMSSSSNVSVRERSDEYDESVELLSESNEQLSVSISDDGFVGCTCWDLCCWEFGKKKFYAASD